MNVLKTLHDEAMQSLWKSPTIKETDFEWPSTLSAIHKTIENVYSTTASILSTTMEATKEEKTATTDFETSTKGFINTMVENVMDRSSLETSTVGSLSETSSTFETTISSTTTNFVEDMSVNINGVKSLLADMSTEKPLFEINNNVAVTNIKDWLTNITTEKIQPLIDSGENTFNATIENIIKDVKEATTREPLTTSTITSINDWILHATNEKFEIESQRENSTSASTLETSFNEFSNNTTQTLLQTFSNEGTTVAFTSDTDLSNNIHTSTTENMQKSLFNLDGTTEFLSTVSDDMILGKTEESTSLLDLDLDIIIYIAIGVILVVSIVLFVGIYLCCRRCKRGREVTGAYYISQMKDYSNSSAKSPETTTDTMVNIKL